jgi:hypothetical protein
MFYIDFTIFKAKGFALYWPKRWEKIVMGNGGNEAWH